jgi:hypothetical protein
VWLNFEWRLNGRKELTPVVSPWVTGSLADKGSANLMSLAVLLFLLAKIGKRGAIKLKVIIRLGKPTPIIHKR